MRSIILILLLAVFGISAAWAGKLSNNTVAQERKDYTEAVKHYRLAAQQGDADAQYNLGLMYDIGQGVPRDYAEAAKWYRKAADQGYAKAQHNLGVMYDTGQGVPQDYAEAVKWHRKAANQGHAKAQHNLGFIYAKGQGVPQDYIHAYVWFNLAAVSGETYAAKNRNIVANLMTPKQIAEAQKITRECTASKLKGCN